MNSCCICNDTLEPEMLFAKGKKQDSKDYGLCNPIDRTFWKRQKYSHPRSWGWEESDYKGCTGEFSGGGGCDGLVETLGCGGSNTTTCIVKFGRDAHYKG